MQMKEWLLAGFDPPFATVDEWISDLIGRVGAEEEAVYALRARDGDRDGIRILVATDIGLFDFFWFRPEDVAKRSLTSRHVPWRDVRGLALSSDTRLEPSTLLRREPAWRLALEEPRVSIDEPPSEAVVLDFWRACHEGVTKGTAG
jgi:hypothetical protein